MAVWLSNGVPVVGTLEPSIRDSIELGEKAASDAVATAVYGPMSDEDYRAEVEAYREAVCSCLGYGYVITAPDSDSSRDWIERCDECVRYPGDIDAAIALSMATGQLIGFAKADCTFGDTLRPFVVPGVYVDQEDR